MQINIPWYHIFYKTEQNVLYWNRKLTIFFLFDEFNLDFSLTSLVLFLVCLDAGDLFDVIFFDLLDCEAIETGESRVEPPPTTPAEARSFSGML